MNYDVNQVLLHISRSEELKKNLSEIFQRNREKQQAFRTEERKSSPISNGAYQSSSKDQQD